MSRFSRIFFTLIVLAFSLVGLAVTYQAFVQGGDVRSKAAQSEVIFKRWELNGVTTEGWGLYPTVPSTAGEQPKQSILSNTIYTKGGYLFLTPMRPSQVLGNVKVSATLPKGEKTLSVRLSIGGTSVLGAKKERSDGPERKKRKDKGNESKLPPVGCYYKEECNQKGKKCQEVLVCPSPTPTPTPKKTPTISIRVYYSMYSKGTSSSIQSSKPLVMPPRFLIIPVVADGTMNTITGTFLDYDPIDIQDLHFDLKEAARMPVQIDWIRLSGEKSPPPCYPRPVCADGVKTESGAVLYCDPKPGENWCPPSSPTPLPCKPRPNCLDTPLSRCFPQEPTEGWCPPISTPVPCAEPPSYCRLGFIQSLCPPPPPGSRYCPKPTPSLTPTPCKYGVDNFSVYDPCVKSENLDLYRHAQYSCYGPIRGVLGTGDKCLSSSEWRNQAILACGRSSNCDITPTPTPLPPGCYYQDVVCKKAPCNPILVCPVPTKYTTPSPRPTPYYTVTPTPKSGVICTQDVQLCPDGKTWVGRTGPNCEFTPCPSVVQ